VKSHEALRLAVEHHGPKQVAADLGVSMSLVYKWCEDASGASGTPNPLDRVADLVRASGSTVPVQWLCGEAGGTFLPGAPPSPLDSTRVVDEAQRMLKEFSDLLAAVTTAFLDGHVTAEEARAIRREWAELQPIAEGLVRACEAQAEPKSAPRRR
jgi:transcriptional regulator with XRE-family HTH domain